jgi:hypothetical protein
MVDQKTVIRADSLSNLVDRYNALADRDAGRSWSPVVWRPDSPSYGLDLDNAQGNHANFGSGVLTIQDAGITTTVPLGVTGDILATGNLVWRSGTANGITLDHAATAARTVTFQDLAGAVALLGASNGGHLLFVDNPYDIGASGATRPRDLHLSRNAVIGGDASMGALTATKNVAGFLAALSNPNAAGRGLSVSTMSCTSNPTAPAPRPCGSRSTRTARSTATATSRSSGCRW